MGADPIVIVGGGVGGLSLAARLAHRGARVVVLEKEAEVGGKMRTLTVAGRPIDAGPTVLTMRWVFDELYRDLGQRLDDHLTLAPLEVLARHRFADGSVLDLYADKARTAEAIRAFAGAREAQGYLSFCTYAERILRTVEEPFLRSPLPSLGDLATLRGIKQMAQLSTIDGTRTMARALEVFFADARLRQLFGRYATYTGSSPFKAPATLNVIAAVEQAGAWVVKGGMAALRQALRELATRAGARIMTGAHVTEIEVSAGRASGVQLAGGSRLAASAVVSNGDVSHLPSLVNRGAGLATTRPEARSFSAHVVTAVGRVSGFELEHHNVFFSANYAREFAQIEETGDDPFDPTIYVCAQDRGPFSERRAGAERLLMLVNAKADGDAARARASKPGDAWQEKMISLLSRHGLSIEVEAAVTTGPGDFARLFPATGGALYGAASHGMTAAFARAQSRTPIERLYVVGGSAHPGAGVPMVALSASIAERSICSDLAATWPSRREATPGGTSTRSLTTSSMR